MQSDETRQVQYPDGFIRALQAVWGEGFLSPGGPDEIREILDGTDLSGLHVLDVGCGVGGIDCLLATDHGAASVDGIDVEPLLIESARHLTADRGLSERVRFHLVEPGPFPFEANRYDVVFTKDAMLHIPDKHALYIDVLRVLKPGGVFIGGDWLSGVPGMSDDLRTWARVNHLDVMMKTPEETKAAIEDAGFLDVHVTDRNDWYREELRKEERLIAEHFDDLVSKLGREDAEGRAASAKARRRVVDSGDLRPSHIRARKPA